MRHTLPNWSAERLQKQRFGDLTFLRVYDLLRPSSRKTKARKRKRRQDEDAEDEPVMLVNIIGGLYMPPRGWLL